MIKKYKKLFSPVPLNGNLGDIASGLTVYKSRLLTIELLIKLFNLRLHGKIMYDWLHLPYAFKYRKENGKYETFIKYYSGQQSEKPQTNLIIYLKDIPVGFCKVYLAAEDEIAAFIDAGNNDYGIYLLPAPPKKLIEIAGKEAKGLTVKILLTILEMLFIMSEVENVYIEPDIQNTNFCNLAQKVGFVFIKEMEMSYKKARLYRMKREDFLTKYPPPVPVNT